MESTVGLAISATLVGLVGCSHALSFEATTEASGHGLLVTVDPPFACYDEVSTKTAVLTGFVGRDATTGVPLDGVQACQEVDTPGSLEEGSTGIQQSPLVSDLSLTLVLDASTSMVRRGQFEALLAAAKETVQTAVDGWADRPGEIHWRFVWFNDLVYRPPSLEDLRPDDLDAVVAPPAAATTRLYSAFAVGIDLATEFRTVTTELDHYSVDVLIAFTDGEDNSSGRPIELHETDGCDPATCLAVAPPVVDERGVRRMVQDRPWLHVFTLALGDEVDAPALRDIARANQRGRLIEADEEDGVATLFREARLELAQRRVLGFFGPVEFGQARWTLDVFRNRAAARDDQGSVRFTLAFDPRDLAQCTPGVVEQIELVQQRPQGIACTFE